MFTNKKTILLVLALALGLSGEVVKADFTFGTPTNLGPTVNSSAVEAEPSIPADELELFFCGDRPGGSGNWDLWVTTRTTTEDDWGTPVNLGPTVNSSAHDLAAKISTDGLELYFGSKRSGGFGGYDAWVTRRATKSDPWGAPVNLGPTVNSEFSDGPSTSAKGLELYFKSKRPGGYGDNDLWVSIRTSTEDDWGTPVNLGPSVNTSFNESYPWIFADGLTLLFSDGVGNPRPGGFGDSDIWMTTRKTRDDDWGEPVNLGPIVNTPYIDRAPSISADGSTLYFASNRLGGSGVLDIWQAPILPIVDFNGDGIVDAADVCIMVDNWGTDEPLCDIGPMPWGDGIVDVQDLIALSEHLFTYPGAVAYWKLDETEGSIAYESASDNDGVLNGGPLWQPTGGAVDGALEFDGTDDYVSSEFVLNPADGVFSVVAWIMGGAPGQVVISQAGGGNWLLTDPQAGALMTELKGSGRTGGPLPSQTVVTDGEWHRIGLVWDGSYRTLYVDGTEVAKDTQAQEYLEGVNGGLYLGAGSTLDAVTFFSGLIDDVRIYNRAVTP
jgi:hypothetical protein